MTARAAWSTDEADTLVVVEQGNDIVEVTHHHIDEFDADEDFSVVVGEFTLEALQRALIPPLPAPEHAANKRLNPLSWLRRRSAR